jgi:cereblon
LEEDLIQELPIISRPGIILMPGQTLPLNFFQPMVISLMKKLIEGTKTFGVIHQRYRASHPGLVEEATIGTTAEIYEYREPEADSLELGLKIKAKGRQRFKVLSQRRSIDGTKIATVEILKEIQLPDPMWQIRLISRDRLRPWKPEPDVEPEKDPSQCTSSSSGYIFSVFF